MSMLGHKRRIVWFIVILTAVWLAWRFFSPGADGPKHSSMAALPVRVASVRIQDMPHYLSGLGLAQPSSDVLVTSRVDGELMRLHFTEGQRVKAGDLLAEIDPRPLQATLDEALGALARDEAQLQNARHDLARYAKLAGGDFIAGQQYETQRALVRQYEGTVEADRGTVKAAGLQLEYSRVTAPSSGRLGLKQVIEGNHVRSSDTGGLVRITETMPCDVVFTLPEKFTFLVLHALRERERDPGAPRPPVEAWNKEESRLIATGELVSMDNQIDLTTNTIKLKASFANSDESLYSNQFVVARLKVRTLRDAVTLPASAVQLGMRGMYVYVVDAEDTAHLHEVTPGVTAQGVRVIDKGLQAGDRVVIDGVDRLSDGVRVNVAASVETPVVTQ
ncbi:MAG: MdtA/MuxA family multidrug efflux RND transporter periplasmic adaptor subunit [Desulfovibrio sp.]|nr:MdtA/MuxA family multidrug efflux RND transporter periplasmic adaptor subunit [Desulfovibrio sp.]